MEDYLLFSGQENLRARTKIPDIPHIHNVNKHLSSSK